MVKLHHTDLGGTGHPPLLVLHGLLGSSRNWQTVGRDLAKQFHVFALDARNHGRSPHAAVMNYDVMMTDIIHWMDDHNLAQAVVVGHSMGGKTAMRLACRHPERVARLVVVDIAPKDYRWAAHRAEFAALNELDLAGLHSRQEAEMRFEARVPNLGMRKFLATNLEHSDGGHWRWSINLPVLTAALP
ncbi:MAG: alpha/beta fold hydrolase, partial [Opitutae bacterium]